MGRTFLIVVAAFALIVAIDVPGQIWNHRRQLRMTTGQVREGRKGRRHPQIKAAPQLSAATPHDGRVPKADVIVTNPTHYAVALRYRDDAMRAPRVVAKGAFLLAERIVEVGQASAVPMLRAPALARALFAHAELGRDIPAALYTAVAEVLAWVYQLRRAKAGGDEEPVPPVDLRVPPDLDPEGKSAP